MCRRLAEVQRVRFDHYNAYGRLAGFRRVCVYHCKVCRRLAEVGTVDFHHVKVLMRLAPLRSV